MSNQLHLHNKDLHQSPMDEVKLVGILADDVVGKEEVLVRSLGRHAGRWYGIAGATEFRDGAIALVLDSPA